MPQNIIVCGPRTWCSREKVEYVEAMLDSGVALDSTIFHGYAKGVDTIASMWAKVRGVRERGFAAHWKEHGKAAGPIRNRKMLESARIDLVFAFQSSPSVKTPGTQNMVRLARSRKVPVTVYYYMGGCEYFAPE